MKMTGIVTAAALVFGCSGTDESGIAGGAPGDTTAAEGGAGAVAAGGGAGPSASGGGALSGGGTGGLGEALLGGSSVSFDAGVLRAIIAARDVAPGAEEHICAVVHLPNDQPVQVDEVRATLTDGSHHLIVDRRPTGTAEQPVPRVCAPTMGESSRLIIGQQHDTRIVLPEPAAYSLEANQSLFLQLHYINTTAERSDIVGTVELSLADAGAELVEVESLFTGSFSIDIPAHSTGSAESFVVPRADTGIRHVFALTSHTHSLGVRATIERVDSAAAPPTEPLHESLDWAEPPLTTFDTPLEFDGTDGLRLRCEYENTTDRAVYFGTAFEDEMCFMWIYYYDL